MMSMTISAATRRRYILGKQGLWPGRRWQGLAGVDEAVRALAALQVDPVSVIAASHDLMLWGRVADYRPEYLDRLLYTERRFFDYGSWLAIYPMAELPYWRVLMARRQTDPRWLMFEADHPGLTDSVRRLLRERGPLRNRELDGGQVNHYRAGKDTGVALYYLWLMGELMTHRRHGKERVYDFLVNVAPPEYQYIATEAEAVAHFTRQGIAQLGMVTDRAFRSIVQDAQGRSVALKEAQAELAARVVAGELTAVTVPTLTETFYFPAADVAVMEELENGRCPTDWAARVTTTDEVTFLSPLDMVSARGRAAKLFDFNYTWEIYKPAEKRQYGPYTLPILYGDRLVARTDMKLDRPRHTLVVNGFWLEDWFQPDEAFATALAGGLRRFAAFLEADHLDTSALAPSGLWERVASSK